MKKHQKGVLDKIPKSLYKHGHYFPVELYCSDAYQSLNISARNLFFCLLIALRYSYNRKKFNKKEYINNGFVSFTEVQFKELFGYSTQTYLNARNKLIEVGLIRQESRGGMGRGDMATYKILVLSDVQPREQRWQNYPNKNWLNEIPRDKNTMVGVKTRFKKGKSGRKLKPTLIK